MSDLVKFLIARVDEDKETARKASQGKWKLWGMSVMADRDGTSNVDTAVPVAQTYSEGERPRTWNANHIARHDPARVLAECAAKRTIVDAHPGQLLEWDDDGWPTRLYCDTCYYDANTSEANAWPCVTLRSLATVYADHPDYREEWTL